MGFDNDCILNISSLAGEYFCPVCHLLVYPNEALQAPCTHLYCKPCLTYVVSTTHACPYDGYRVTEADCKPLLESNKSLADTIGKIQVHCLYYRTGCTWQGPLTDCTSHYSTCSYGESPVLCNRCGVQIVHRQVQEHAQNCPGVQSQAQQPSTAQDSTAIPAADQSQTVAQTGLSASQAQATPASAPLVSGQDAIQAANSGAQPQATQATMPTAEQWYQQQQQYQQYYQQYPGYDPYQQNYQYYYQYQQGVQPYAQQPMQGYPPQAYGQAQAQVSGQAQTQSQVQGQQQVQPHAQPQPQQQAQAPSQTAQPLSQPNAKPAANAQPQALPVNQGQSQVQAQGQVPPSNSLPYNQPQPLPQAQPYGHTQPQQQMQVPQYQQTHHQVQHPNAQTYPPSQTQTQHYPYSQPQSQVQPQPQPQPQPHPHPQPTMQAPTRPPSQQNQPMNPSAQFQTHNPVTGYQSYPQPHPQAQAGAPHPMHVPGAQPQPQYPTQVQGKLPSQPSQMYPPQPYSNVANQQQQTMPAAQGQPPNGPPAQQVPVYPHTQQPGYPFQHRTGAVQQAAPQNYGQQQSFPGHGPFTPPQPTMPGQLHAQGPPQTLQQPQQNYAPGYGAQPTIPQNYPARPVAAQGHQPYAQGSGYAGTGQARPPLPNQGYPIRPDNQLSAASEQLAGFPQQTSRATGGDKSRDQMLDKSIHDQKDPNKEVRDLAGVGVQVNDIKSENSLDNGNDSRGPGTHDAQEHKPRMKGDVSEGVSEPSPGSNAGKSGADDQKDSRKKAEVQDLKHTANSTAGAPGSASNMPQSHSGPQAHGTNSFPSVNQGRNQPQPMHYGHSGQHRPGAAPMPQPPHHSYNSQQPALGHPPGQLRPHGPGQIPPRPPFNAAENSQPPIPKHNPGAIPHENASGANLGPGSSAPFARPGNLGYHQRPPFAAQRPGEFDSHVGMEGRERADVEQRPTYPIESEKYQAQRPGYFDGRKSESLSHGMERVPYGPAHQPGAMRFGGPSAHDAMSGMRDERVKSFHEENLKPFPHRDFEEDLRKFPRSSHLDAGPSSKYGPQFPSSGPLDHGPHVFGGDGMPRPFDKSHHGFDRDGSKVDAGSGPSRFLPPFHPNDAGERGRAGGYPDDNIRREEFGHRADFSGTAPGPGFGRSRMDGMPPRSPGRDFSGFPPRTFGAYGDGGNERRPFEGSRPYDFPAEPFGKSIHENRFPVPPNHLQRGEHDVPGNMRMGEHLAGGPRTQDMLPGHLRRGEHMGPRNLHMGEATPFGPPGGLHRMGEPPLAGNFPQHLPFGESFGGEKPGHPLAGEPGFRGGPGFQRYAREGGFYPEEMEPFNNPRKRKPGSIMCRICKVECGSVDGLDLHSQSREHQKKARDMVLSIKQQNKKKQKMSKGQAFVEGRDGGRPKNSSLQGRGNKR